MTKIKARESRTAYRTRAKPRAQTQPEMAASDYPEQGKWTYDAWARLPYDGMRYEVIDGELYMTPPPTITHQSVSGNLFEILRAFVREHQLGIVLTAPIGVRLPAQPVPLQPDIVFVAAQHKSMLGKEYIEGVPDLMVEILSPSNWIYDRNEKFMVYQTAGVPEYWIVDYRAKTLDFFCLEDGIYALTGKWGIADTASSRVLAGLQVRVSDIFRDL